MNFQSFYKIPNNSLTTSAKRELKTEFCAPQTRVSTQKVLNFEYFFLILLFYLCTIPKEILTAEFHAFWLIHSKLNKGNHHSCLAGTKEILVRFPSFQVQIPLLANVQLISKYVFQYQDNKEQRPTSQIKFTTQNQTKETVNKPRKSTNYEETSYQLSRWVGQIATGNSCPNIPPPNDSATQAHFLTVSYRLHCWRKTTPRAPAVRDSIENLCQSTPLHTQQAKMWETPVPVTTPAPARPITPCILLHPTQDSGSHLSQLSCPLFTEDRYSTSSEDDQEACDAEITQINK